ncbi:Alpha/Beta hydrolase protein, partial [Mycena olivaceomarginata]
IVLVHGLSIPALVWGPLVPPLVAAGYRVLLYDLYGRGYSAAPVGATYDAQLYVSQLALLMQHLGVSMGGAITAAFVSTFPALASDLPRTAKVMSSPFIQALTANPLINAYLRHLASKTEEHHDTGGAPQEGPLRELVRLQSAHLPGFNRAVSSSLRAGPVTGMRWAFESEGWAGRKVLLLHGTSDQTVPSAHSTRIGALIESAGRNTSSTQRKNQNHKPTPGRARVTLIPDAGHALTWTHAREVGEVVCAFLAG